MRRGGTLLAALGFLSFAAVYANVVMSPVLVEIANEFQVSTGTAGLLVAVYGLPGIVVGLLVGPLSDRYGRRPFLVWGTVVMSVLTLAGVFATSFVLLLVTRVLAGIGASVIFPNANATVGDSFAYRERGRAMSTIIAANTFATIVGVPLAGIVAEALTWRVALAIVGGLGLVAAGVLWRALPRDAHHDGRGAAARALYGRILGDASARAAILSSLFGALFWFTWITYVVAFFQHTFALSEGAASTVVLTTGLGALVGSQVGGRLGDRIGHRPVVGWSIAIAGALLFLEASAGTLALAVTLNFLVAAASGARFATNTALLSELAPEARGTMMAVNSSIVSAGIVFGTSLGGLLIDRFGFAALGAFSFAAALTSALVVWRFVTESAAEMAAGEAIE